MVTPSRSEIIDAVRRRAHAAAEGRAPSMTDDEHAQVQAFLERQAAEQEAAEAMRRQLAQQRALEEALRRRAAQAAAPAEDMSPSIANAERLGMPQQRESAPVADVQQSPEMRETPPSSEWQRWRDAVTKADRETGDRSLLGAAKQFYLSQTEPAKYGGVSEGDAVKLGLSMLPTLPFAGAAITRPLLAGAAGAASTLPDYALGTSTAGDVATNAGLSAGITGGLNKLVGLLGRGGAGQQAARQAQPSIQPQPQPTQQMDLGLDMPIPIRPSTGLTREQWLNQLSEAQAAGGGIDRMGRLNRIGDEMEDWGVTGGIPEDVVMQILQNSYRRPFQRKKPRSIPRGEQMSLDLGVSKGKPKPQFKQMSPQGEWVDETQTQFASGGRVSDQDFDRIVTALETALR